MYRNVYFDGKASTMHLWTWNEDGQRVEVKEHFKPYIYIECQNDYGIKSIYNTNLRKFEFRNNFERNKYIKNSGIKRVFYNIRPEQQYLIDKFGFEEENKQYNPLDVLFLDIEVYTCKYPLNTIVQCKSDDEEFTQTISKIIEYGADNMQVWDTEANAWKNIEQSCFTQTSEFPDPTEAEYPINVITIYSTLHKQFFTWGLHGDYTPTQDNVNYIQCKTEKDLLNHFLAYWKAYTPDVMSGWNSEFFDLPYIINRIKKVFYDEKAKILSPVKDIYYRENVSQTFGRSNGKWYIRGLSCIDYMEAYKKFSRGDRASYSLDYIAEYELKEGKVKFNASDLSRLAITDWKTFIDYNIQDVNLLVRLEEKLKYIELIKNIAYKGLSPLESSLGTIGVVTGAMARSALKQGMVIPTFEHKDKQSYVGGFVMEPQRGLQPDVVSFDANSLYPNTIISLNISPETKLGKIVEKNKDSVVLELVDGKRYTLSNAKFAKFIKESNACVSKARVLFSQNKKGFCPSVVDDIYQERVDTRNALYKVRKKQSSVKNKLKKDPNNEELQQQLSQLDAEVNQLDVYQYTIKIFLNSLYGTFANNYSPFYDIDIASSITMTGQHCVRQAGEIVNKYVKENDNLDTDLLLYMDTDSVSGDTLVRTTDGVLQIQDLFDLHNENNKISNSPHGHETIIPTTELKCLTLNKENVEYGEVRRIIRHKVSKKKYKIKVDGQEVIMTEDHGCMVYRDENLIRVSAKDILPNDKMVKICL